MVLSRGSVSSAILKELWTAGVLTGGIQGLGFLHGYFTQTEAFFDALGGVNSLGFVALNVVLGQVGDAGGGALAGRSKTDFRRVAMLTLFALSRLWLLALLFYRAKKRKGDSRFEDIKPYFFKYMVAWLLQGVWVFFIATPLFVINGWRNAAASESVAPVRLNAFDILLLATFIAALGLQISADITKFRWVEQGRPGGFCKVGVWRFSRHPNYFGEMVMWWCAFGLTLRLWIDRGDSGIGPGWCLFALLSPVTTMMLLLFVSGLPFCEGAHLKRYWDTTPGFPEYWRSTSILVPMPRVVWRALPAVVKRIFFCELRRYAYQSSGEKSTSKKSSAGARPPAGVSSSDAGGAAAEG